MASFSLSKNLKKHFGHNEFKSDLQRKATEAVLKSKCVLAL